MSSDSERICLSIVAGCYERTVLGYDVVCNNDDTYSIAARFTDNSHIGYIKAIAGSRTFLASGSTDETIHLYNLETNTELGTLLQHDGSITCLCFHGDSHMMSSSEDGTMCVWDTKTWDCMKVLRGHKGGARSVAIHPSGKLALSVGADKTLRTWNLLKGRAAYTTNIKQVADHVLWSPDGQLYIVVINSVIDVYNITTASIVCSMECKNRINAAAFVTDRVVAVGGEGNEIRLFKIGKSEMSITTSFKAHENRIKALQCVASPFGKNQAWLVSASSDGYIKVWNLNINKLSEKPALLAELDTTARLTCMTVRQIGAEETEEEKEDIKLSETEQSKLSPKQTTGKRSKPSERQGAKSKKRKTKLTS